ncbi:23S rRNA (guanosine(2251)-2'-O)-methyltransferase RlmB [Iocasia frigidifontis]|uniref:23S rRNA (Guanosine(2251)-2'-O)-methyltransferase RlmB n=1 Tax=Iocasia fonsfrigidae TaxID=2682810 RepID=A0A8A7KHR4_9FIRM|nr:23S rRNA (guanosine(2251)-2'-O)-methyltransferase RlmB [Iocasia fonsfrigidae]QTL99318.1 23S rRNA (guanosine(2251)-2'-O)-methyltransferase RlmB [Iocasia fonsfrigidae]
MAKIEGRNPVIEALKGNRKLDRILIKNDISGDKIDWIISQARRQGVIVERVSRNTLDKLALSHAHQGVIAIGETLTLVSVDDILKYAYQRDEQPFIIILDQIQDPHNFGSIIRTSYAAGAHGIIFQEKRAVGVTPVVAKSSAGAIEHIRLAEVTNINQTIDRLKEEGLWIAGADMQGQQAHYQADLKGKIGLVIGSEGQGLRRLTREKCDFLIKIPMLGELGSLNASVAAAIIIYEIVRQRA